MGIFDRHRNGFWTSDRLRSFFWGLLLVVLAIVVQLGAGNYAARHAALAGPQSDFFLDRLPVVNLGFIIIGAAILFWIFSCALLVLEPKYLLFGIKAMALFIITRAVFMNLTHEGVYPGGIVPGVNNFGYGFYHLITFQGNLFFSGHTGFPFLMALLFWNRKFLRRFFLAATVVFGVSVLLAHVHYSIDVFAAPFIVYGIFVIAAKFFPKDYALCTGT